MKIYIWNSLTNVTSNYHSGGAAVVIANDIDEARKLVPIISEGEKYEDVIEERKEMPVPDGEYEISAKEPKAFIFPDSGCC